MEQDFQYNGDSLSVERIFVPSLGIQHVLPLFMSPVSAGFPSPAEGYIEQELNLNKYFIRNPNTTFFLRVTGDPIPGAGIHDGDLLIVDRSLPPRDGKVVVAVSEGDLLIRCISFREGRPFLISEFGDEEAVPADMEIWGVVTTVLHSL